MNLFYPLPETLNIALNSIRSSSIWIQFWRTYQCYRTKSIKCNIYRAQAWGKEDSYRGLSFAGTKKIGAYHKTQNSDIPVGWVVFRMLLEFYGLKDLSGYKAPWFEIPVVAKSRPIFVILIFREYKSKRNFVFHYMEGNFSKQSRWYKMGYLYIYLQSSFESYIM